MSTIEGISIPYRNTDSEHVFHQYTLQLADNINRDELIQFLKEKNIPAMVYYPVPAHQQKMFASMEVTCSDMSNTEWLTSRVISLPMHTELSKEQQDSIINRIKEYFNKWK